MIKHNFKVSLRNFNRYRISFLVNLLALVGGLVTALFIYTWVDHELSVDKFQLEWWFFTLSIIIIIGISLITSIKLIPKTLRANPVDSLIGE